MNICGCKTKCDCTLIAVIASVITGVITAFLNFSATIALPQFVLWIFFGIDLAFLAVSLIAAPLVRRRDNESCMCPSLTAFFAGILGTVLFSLVLILVDIATSGLLGSLITGLLFAFFTLTITSAACIVKNIVDC